MYSNFGLACVAPDMERAEDASGVSQDFHPLDINMEEEAHEQEAEPVSRQQEAELVHRQQVSGRRSVSRCAAWLRLAFLSVRLRREGRRQRDGGYLSRAGQRRPHPP